MLNTSLAMTINEGIAAEKCVPGLEDGRGSKVPERLRLVIADDDPAILDQVAQILSRFEVVARARNGRVLVEAVDRTEPDIVVTDLSMPVMNGIEATRGIVRARPRVKVVILSVHDDPYYVDAAFEAGASAYVLKIDASRELLAAVDSVWSGGIYRSERLVD